MNGQSRSTSLRLWGVGLIVSAGVVGAGFLTVPRVRELSRRVACGANLRDIGQCLKRYSSEFPTDRIISVEEKLNILVNSGRLAPEQLVCPSGGRAYIFSQYPRLALSEERDTRLPIAYEPLSNHGGEGGNILFGDGHVDFMRVAEYEEAIRGVHGNTDEYSHVGRAWPDAMR